MTILALWGTAGEGERVGERLRERESLRARWERLRLRSRDDLRERDRLLLLCLWSPLGASSIGASMSSLGVRVRPRETLRFAAGDDIGLRM